jgi:hypothetical protein
VAAASWRSWLWASRGASVGLTSSVLTGGFWSVARRSRLDDQDWINASKSLLIVSACVVGIPCGLGDTGLIGVGLQESLAAADAAVMMQTLGTAYLQITKQWGDVIQVVIDVAPHDSESATVFATAQRRHHRNLTTICRRLEDIGALRDDVDARLATRIITYYYGIDGLLRTRDVFGWSSSLRGGTDLEGVQQRLASARRVRRRVKPACVRTMEFDCLDENALHN